MKNTAIFSITLTALTLFVQLSLFGQETSNYITVDQFGYRIDSKKIAVIRNPVSGFDAALSFSPGNSYSVINIDTEESVFTGQPVLWNEGATDGSSGDAAWWFDFSSVTTPGTYYVLDDVNNVRSYEFNIADDIYDGILKTAVRTFFYQRAGYAKDAAFAGTAWADAASHTGNLQDKNARQYNRKNDSSTERDVSGGWYDAGDYNKYTNWTANYVVDFMLAYLENPSVWGDDYNIPESGNNVPDILDEAKWGIDHLLRMQNDNGSVLSIVGLSHASPPSSATGPSYYGTASTSATLNTAGAVALASKVFASRGNVTYANTLKESAIAAWDWAEGNPSVIFKNNDGASGTSGLGAGQQETDDYGRLMAKLEAAVYLFDLTGETKYKEFFDNNFQKVHLIEWNYAYPFETSNQKILLYYTTLANASPTVVETIKSVYKNAMNSNDNFGAVSNARDPYSAFIKDYTWGSNATKGSQSLMFLDVINYDIDATRNEEAKDAAEGYVHYLHGVNPLNFVYLSNMYDFGADNGVNEFYHTWFSNGSAKWDRVGSSTHGPAPGFVTGGPNPSYDKDGCCATNSCGGSNAMCDSENLTPPMNQPAQKAYKDFNTSWPLNSWSVTENSNGYQLNYIRMLSYFVTNGYDCSGEPNGGASFDACNICSGGNTGVIPQTDPSVCVEPIVTASEESIEETVSIFPNPANGELQIVNANRVEAKIEIFNSNGVKIYNGLLKDRLTVNLRDFSTGLYKVLVFKNGTLKTTSIITK